MQEFGFFLICLGLGAAAVSIGTVLLIAISYREGRVAYRKNWRLLLHQQVCFVSLGLVIAAFGVAAYKGSAEWLVLAIAGIFFALAILLLTHFLQGGGIQRQ